MMIKSKIYYIFAVVCFILANMVRNIVFYGTGERSWFQADYAIPVIAMAILQKFHIRRSFIAMVVFLISLFIIANDSMLIFARRFRWGPDALPQYLSSSQDLPWSIILPILHGVISASAIFCLAATWSSRNRFAVWPLISVIGLLQIADMNFGTSRFRDSTSRIDLLTTSAFSTVPIYAQFLFGSASLARLHQESMDRILHDGPLPPRILSVAVESFGLARLPKDRAVLLAPLVRQLDGMYRIEQHAHEFYGATLQGEIRELCGANLTGNASERAVLRGLRRCLPMWLQARGYDTQALHGNGRRFYARDVVYPAMGFRRSWFYDDIVAADPTAGPCARTAFNAVCDSKLYTRALSLFDGRKRFVHVMTLDSHLPVPDGDERSCVPAIVGDAARCRYTELITKSLRELGSAIVGSRFKPDLIFLYGDHAPPFSATATRTQFSSRKVPFLVLRRIDRGGP